MHGGGTSVRLPDLALALLIACGPATDQSDDNEAEPTSVVTESVPPSPSPEAQSEGMVGDTLESPSGNLVTLHDWTENREVARLRIQQSETFYVADVEFCKEGETDPGLAGSDVAFALSAETSDNRNFNPDGTGYRGDYLIAQFRPLADGECIRGPVGFVIPRDATVEALTLAVQGGALEWQV
jgi:hypothetical protein